MQPDPDDEPWQQQSTTFSMGIQYAVEEWNGKQIIISSDNKSNDTTGNTNSNTIIFIPTTPGIMHAMLLPRLVIIGHRQKQE